jgi:3-phenylpropionate/cinnamic acid dioxygenase small subunit
MTLDEVVDRLELDDLLTRFAVAVDTKDFDLLDTVFTHDAALDYSQPARAEGPYAEMKAWIVASMIPFEMCQHLIVNRWIEVTGETARCRSYLYNPLAIRGADGALHRYFVGGTYDDRCVKTPDGWRIAERVHRILWTEGDVVAP